MVLKALTSEDCCCRFRGVGGRFGASGVVCDGSRRCFGGSVVVSGLRLGVSCWLGRSLREFLLGLLCYDESEQGGNRELSS